MMKSNSYSFPQSVFNIIPRLRFYNVDVKTHLSLANQRFSVERLQQLIDQKDQVSSLIGLLQE